MNTKKLILNFYSDAGHGWLRVSKIFMKEISLILGYPVVLGVSDYSYYKDGWLYLEEDADAPHVLENIKKAGIRYSLKVIRSEYSKIRSYPRFNHEFYSTKGN